MGIRVGRRPKPGAGTAILKRVPGGPRGTKPGHPLQQCAAESLLSLQLEHDPAPVLAAVVVSPFGPERVFVG